MLYRYAYVRFSRFTFEHALQAPYLDTYVYLEATNDIYKVHCR